MKKLMIFCCMLLAFAAKSQQLDKISSVLEFQKKINSEFKDADHSPLSNEERETFESLNFFPIDTSFIISAEFVRTPHELPFEMATTTERKPIYVKYGEVYFKLKEREFKLDIFQNQQLILKEEYQDYLFLPFTDQTNGQSTYAGGRYLDLRIPEGKNMVLDFNRAYNPYCAYNGKYSCPIPPPQNELDVKVEAGVKAYENKSKTKKL